ncbi:hypothetical protein ES319_D07G088400v1 [Gossypium barbadense]|uniref:HTH myb-type domain-containing protein n=1 Tax=Gossypium barbadense TaxID=3634 RepID=A0A5J5QRX6_GOSBA|nr:hypothetical protein ES319_D07G088400v1 [Gossypium barbadense]
MNPNSVELSLSLKPFYVPKSLSSLFLDLSKIDNQYYKLSVLSDYIGKLEEEFARVQPLKHLLPQCTLLLMEAIETLKVEFTNIKNNLKNNEKEGERETQKIISTCSATEEHYGNSQPCKEKGNNMEGLMMAYKENSTWNCVGASSSSGKEKEVAAIEEYSWRNDETFYCNYDHHHHHHHHLKPLTQAIWKNNRRFWSSELHSRFVEALNMLGGNEVATPKQIRDLMQVEGLTIDQVKSHLQVKFNLLSLINNACIILYIVQKK